MAQHIQLQEVFLHGVVFKMGGDLVGIGVIRRVLHGAEIPDLIFLGNNHQAAGVLARGSPDTDAACRKPVFLRPVGSFAPFRQVLFDIAEGGLFRNGANGPRPEDVGLSKHLHTVGVGLGLIFTGKVQVNIRHLVAAEAQEGLEGDVEAVLLKFCAALGTDRIRQVRTAAVALGHLKGGELALRIRTAVMRREGIYLRNAGHIGNNGGAYRATGAYQIAVLQRVLHQLLGRHVNHVIVAGDNIMQLRFHTLGDQLRGILSIKPVQLPINQAFQVLHGVFDFWCEQIVRHRPKGLAHIRNEVGIGHHHLVGFFRPQIAELLQHVVGGTEIQGVGLVRVIKALGVQKDMPKYFILRVEKVNVTGGNHHLPQRLAQPDDGSVVFFELLHVLGHALGQHEHIVRQGLDLQIVVEGGDALQLILALSVQHGLEQLACLTGRADDQALPQLHKLRFGNSGHTLKVFQVGIGNQVV